MVSTSLFVGMSPSGMIIHDSHTLHGIFTAIANSATGPSSNANSASGTGKEGEAEEDYKGESKFASHLKANQGVSNFARTRTLKEQREYLPAFAVREELLKTIRENQGTSIKERDLCA
jgi:hypothetical protein